jgi:cytochrome c5
LVAAESAPQVVVKKMPVRAISSTAGDQVDKAYCENCHDREIRINNLIAYIKKHQVTSAPTETPP